MKQTAVEWLENEFKEAHKMFGGIDTNWIKRFDQAKEMEKEQIVNAYKEGWNCPHGEGFPETGEQYYNETFNKSINKQG
jgi:hypothetical protein